MDIGVAKTRKAKPRHQPPGSNAVFPTFPCLSFATALLDPFKSLLTLISCRVMARKKIRGYNSKRLLKEHLKRLAAIDLHIRSSQATQSTDFPGLINQQLWLSCTKLVVKPDMLFGKRGKSGLVALNLDVAQVAQSVKALLGVEVIA